MSFFIVAVLALKCWSISDTRRGAKTLRRRPSTVITKKASTSSYPGAVRD